MRASHFDKSTPCDARQATNKVANPRTEGQIAAAFKREFKHGRFDLLRRIDLANRRLLIIAGTIAVESCVGATIHVRRRPAQACCFQPADAAANWPELATWTITPQPNRRPDMQRLREAIASLFVGWRQGKRLPASINVDRLIETGQSGTGLVLPGVHTKYEKLLYDVMPERFWKVFDLTPRRWLNLPDPVAPVRLWNRHCAEFNDAKWAFPWLASISGALAHFPVDLKPGATLAQSFERMLSATLSPTVWRFHRDLGFSLIYSVDLLAGPIAETGATVIRAAVKAMGFQAAKRLFGGLDKDFFGTLACGFQYSDLPAIEKPLQRYFGCASARFKEIGASTVMQDELLRVAGWLCWDGFEQGFPFPNSSWASLVGHADAVKAETDLLGSFAEIIPSQWKPPVSDFDVANVRFTAISSLNGLSREGDEMDHCIAAVHYECAEGSSVVFSVVGTLPNGKDVRATAQYKRHHRLKHWVLIAIKGVRNAAVPAELKRIARDAANAFPFSIQAVIETEA